MQGQERTPPTFRLTQALFSSAQTEPSSRLPLLHPHQPATRCSMPIRITWDNIITDKTQDQLQAFKDGTSGFTPIHVPRPATKPTLTRSEVEAGPASPATIAQPLRDVGASVPKEETLDLRSVQFNTEPVLPGPQTQVSRIATSV